MAKETITTAGLMQEAAAFYLWYIDCLETLLRCVRRVVGPTVVLNRIDIEAGFTECGCGQAAMHEIFVGLRANFRSPVFTDSPHLKGDFIAAWLLEYERLNAQLPDVFHSVVRYVMDAAEQLPLTLDGIIFHTKVTRMAIPSPTEASEHSEVFLDLARKGDEAGFKDLARMTLERLSEDEIDEMWTGTAKRLRKKE